MNYLINYLKHIYKLLKHDNDACENWWVCILEATYSKVEYPNVNAYKICV